MVGLVGMVREHGGSFFFSLAAKISTHAKRAAQIGC